MTNDAPTNGAEEEVDMEMAALFASAFARTYGGTEVDRLNKIGKTDQYHHQQQEQQQQQM